MMGKDLKGKELGIGISQQKDGLYSARFVDKYGKRKQKRFKKLQECRQWIADMSFTDKHSDITLGGDMLVDAWYNYWIGVKEKTVRSSTCEIYRRRYELSIGPDIGGMLLADVKPLHCQKILSGMADQGYGSSTIQQTKVILHDMFALAEENDAIQINPCKRSVRGDIGKTPKKREALTIEEQQKFLAGVVGWAYENQYKFVLQTGLRVGELTALKWECVNLEDRTLTVKQTMQYHSSMGGWQIGKPKSEAGYRTIPLTDEAICILKEQKKKSEQRKEDDEYSDLIFLGSTGRPIGADKYNDALIRICRKIGVRRFSMHTLRHTFATRCIEGGMKPKTLQMIMGHANIGMTMNLYVHITEEEKRKEVEQVADALKVL